MTNDKTFYSAQFNKDTSITVETTNILHTKHVLKHGKNQTKTSNTLVKFNIHQAVGGRRM